MSVSFLVMMLVACKQEEIKLGDSSGAGIDDSGGNNNGDDSNGNNGGDDSSGNTDCDPVSVVASTPDNGATDVAFTTEISFTLSGPDTTAEITTDIPGSQSVSSDGLTVSWVPSAPLASETTYTVDLKYCGGSTSVEFTTAESFAGKVENSVYGLELANATIDEPAGVGGMLGDYLPEYVLVEVVSADAASLKLMGALAVEGSNPPEQDVCTESIDFPTADFGGQPYFQVGPADTMFAVAGYNVTLYDMMLAGTFNADGSAIENGELEGSIDARDIAGAVGFDAETLCMYLGYFGGSCSACPSDGEPLCLTLAVSNLNGDVIDGLDLVEVTNPQCLN